ncbi:MAG: tetratricopeptide repeat protein [Candidatus Hodarchaeota archaeon]
MSHPEQNQLTRAEQLFDAGKLDKALEILNDISQYEGLNLQQKSYFQFLKGLILVYMNNGEEVIKLGEEICKEGQQVNNNLQSFDGLIFIIFGLTQVNKLEEAVKQIEKAEDLLRLVSNVSKTILLQRKIRLNVLKAWTHFYVGNMNLAEKCIKWILDSQEELDVSFEIVWANLLMAGIMLQVKARYNIAMEYAKKALSLAKEIKFSHFWIGYCQIGIGVIYSSIGEFDISLNLHLKCLKLFKTMKSNYWIAIVLNNIGSSYYYKGNYDLALEYLEQSVQLYEDIPFSISNISAPIDGLIALALEKDDTELAKKYFQRLENLYNQQNDHRLDLLYQYNKALMLKRSSRIRDKAKSEELLKEIIGKEIINETTIYASINLCDLLLTEFRINNNNEVLDELNHYIAKLLTLAENSHSYLVFCETFILQAKLALLNFNMKAAQRFLTQAQKIAELHGIKRLAMKISHEHDELLTQLKIWENLKESESSLSERWKLAGLNEQMENMVRKRMTKLPQISEEEPVSIFIITEGGTLIFSHSFIDQKSFESHLFSGFLTTIDYFIREMFSEGLDRAIFGEHTLLLKSIPPFFISYIYKGDSYYALQKLNYFIDHIQVEDIWHSLLKSFKVNQSIHLKDIPSLESLITKTFITKSVIFSEI